MMLDFWGLSSGFIISCEILVDLLNYFVICFFVLVRILVVIFEECCEDEVSVCKFFGVVFGCELRFYLRGYRDFGGYFVGLSE